MTWKIRHEGSPRAIEGLTLAQVIEGLRDGLWEPTDETQGTGDQSWVAIENHPQLAEIVADMEHPIEKPFEEESNLDMNPLIDLAMVLLIFFILTASFAALQKVLEMPDIASQVLDRNVVVQPKARVAQFTILVDAHKQEGKTTILIENQPVEEQYLRTEFMKYVRDTRKTEMLLNADNDVDWGTIVAIQDAARGAGVDRAHLNVKPEELRRAPAAH